VCNLGLFVTMKCDDSYHKNTLEIAMTYNNIKIHCFGNSFQLLVEYEPDTLALSLILLNVYIRYSMVTLYSKFVIVPMILIIDLVVNSVGIFQVFLSLNLLTALSTLIYSPLKHSFLGFCDRFPWPPHSSLVSP
jgi:hypothetical protein